VRKKTCARKTGARLAALLVAMMGLAGATARATGFDGPVVYAAPTSRGIVHVYRGGLGKPGAPTFTFWLNPGVANSLQVDGAGNVYLADSYSTWVYELASATTSPMRKIETPQTPFNLALWGTTLYVFEANVNGGSAQIAIFPKGTKKPSAVLSDPAIVFPQGLAVDGDGNVFVAYGGASLKQFGVGEFVHGQMPLAKLKIGGLVPECLAIDGAGNLLIDAPVGSGGTTSLFIFPPGASKPSKVIANLPSLYQISFSAGGQSFFAGPAAGKSFAHYAYPSGKLIYKLREADAFSGFAGIAASPAVKAGVWGISK